MGRYSKTEWEAIRQAVINSYNNTKPLIARLDGFEITEEGQVRVENPMAGTCRGTAQFDSSKLGKQYKLDLASWVISLGERMNGPHANVTIKTPGHHELKVTQAYMNQVSEALSNSCMAGGFINLLPRRSDIGNQSSFSEIWFIANCFPKGS